MGNKWSENTKRYLFGLALLEEAYKKKKISSFLKENIEKELSKSFKENYWDINPNTKHPFFAELLKRMFYTYELTQNEPSGNIKCVKCGDTECKEGFCYHCDKCWHCLDHSHKTQLPKEKPDKGKGARRTVKPEKAKGLVTSERTSGVVDHEFEHSAETRKGCAEPVWNDWIKKEQPCGTEIGFPNDYLLCNKCTANHDKANVGKRIGGCGIDIGGVQCGDFIEEFENEDGQPMGNYYYCDKCNINHQEPGNE